MSLHVVIVNDASTARGGATGLALLSARLLRGRGIAVTLFTGDSGENAELAALGVRIVALGGTRLNAARHRSLTSALYNRAAAAALAEFIVEEDGAEVVYHLHGWGQIFSPAIFTALQPVAARTVIHAHDFFLACPNGAFTDFPRSALCERRPLSLSCLALNCDKRSYAHKIWRVARHGLLERSFPQSLPWAAVAMIHPGMAPHLRRGGLPGSRLVTLRNPAERYRATRVAVEENDRFFFIGRIEPDKGARELAEAARAAGVPLTMIGDGSLREPLAEAYPEVTFPGWKSREEIGEM
ncbi:glycosyltransferase, partial [Thioclava sp. BHET1]